MKHNILVIDDNEDMIELMKLILSDQNYEAKFAHNGQEALDVLTSGFVPNLIIVDHNMEIMNGPDFLIAFERDFSPLFQLTPVVLLTAHDARSLAPNKATEVVKKSGINEIEQVLSKYLAD